ncbi:MAG: AAA family ATPase [Acidobacteriota bacterium]
MCPDALISHSSSIGLPYSPTTPIENARREAAPAERIRLRQSRLTGRAEALAQLLRRSVIGQSEALDQLLPVLARLDSGLRDPNRPLLTALLLGPTGVGKTETARALARGLFGRASCLTRIDCQEYAHGHELAKLIGSPPGYVGHRVEPLLSQRNLDAGHVKALESGTHDTVPAKEDDEGYLSILLFDEVEKAHPTLWNGLLHVLEEGELTLGDNSKTSFRRTILLMTSNVGSRELDRLAAPALGFGAALQDNAGSDARSAVLAAARESFPAEFLNRLDLQLVYGSLGREHLHRILDLQLDALSRRLMIAGAPLLVRLTRSARELIVDRGDDPRYGARPLRRAVETLLADPLASLLAAGELEAGDLVDVEAEGQLAEELAFFRGSRSAVEVVV